MYSKTIKTVLVFIMLCALPCVAQTDADVQKQRQEFEQKAKDDLYERIQTFLSDLKVDDFQKEIIKQKLQSYYERKKAIYMDGSLKHYERDGQLASLDASYFSDIENMITEDTMNQIKLFITDAGSTLEKQKKKKKKNKKNKDE